VAQRITLSAVGTFLGNDTQLFLTQENHMMLRPTKQITRTSLLPAAHPMYSFGRCALVGNSGGLLTASHGSDIDEHDAVLRLNQAPVLPYALHVGANTTFRLLNKRWVAVFSDKVEGQAGLLLAEAPGSTLVLTRASTWQIERLLAVVRRQRPDVQVLVLNSAVIGQARAMLRAFRDEATHLRPPITYSANGTSPSSGFVGLALLLRMCRSVSVYGFGGAYASWEGAPPTQPRRTNLAPSEGVNPPLPLNLMATKAWDSPACKGARVQSATKGGMHVIQGYPAPYHYFVRQDGRSVWSSVLLRTCA